MKNKYKESTAGIQPKIKKNKLTPKLNCWDLWSFEYIRAELEIINIKDVPAVKE